MSEVRFTLKDRTTKSSTMILATFCYQGNRIRFSTGISIPPKYWNKNTEQARELIEFNEASFINEKINHINSRVKSLYNNHILQDTLPDKVSLRAEILNVINHESTAKKAKTFWEIFDEFVEYKRTELNDVRDYHNSLRKHLKNAEIEFGSPITISSLKDQQNSFIETFNHYLKSTAKGADGTIGLSVNTIGKQHKNLKVFLNWCFNKEICNSFSLKHIVTQTEDVEKVYLKHKEVEAIKTVKLKSKKDRIVRDLFVIGCETGLRYSDFTQLSEDHVLNNQIHIRPTKTRKKSKNKLIIPLSSSVKDVITKYNGFPSFTGKLVDFNKIIRKICEKAKVNDVITNDRYKNGKHIQTKHKKFELISSHTCRRTFCTLKFLDGMDAQAIMQFSGHKTERAFMRYLKLDAELTAIKYANFFK